MPSPKNGPQSRKLSEDGAKEPKKCGVSKLQAFWVLFAVCCIAGFIIHLSYLAIRYAGKPIAVEDYTRGTNFTFPDVTLCNSAPYSAMRLKKTYTFHGQQLTGNQILERVKNFWKLALNYTNEKINEPTARDADTSRQTAERIAMHFGIYHPAHEMVIACKYAGEPCSFLNFTNVLLPGHLNCITFPGAKAMGSRYDESGLSLILAALDRHYMLTELEVLDWAQGMLVAIHPPGSMPLFHGRHITAQVGFFSMITVSMTKVIRVNRAKKPCLERLINHTAIIRDHEEKTLQEQTFIYQTESCEGCNTNNGTAENQGFVDDLTSSSIGAWEFDRQQFYWALLDADNTGLNSSRHS